MIPTSTYYSVFHNGKVVLSAAKEVCVREAKKRGAGYTWGITPTRSTPCSQ